MKYLIIILFFCSLKIFAQEPADSTWNIDTLDYNNLDLESDLKFNVSYGWFPSILKSKPDYSIYFSGGDIYDEAQIFSSPSLSPAYFPLIADVPLSSEEREIRKAFSKDKDEDGPVTSFGEVGLGMRIKLFDYSFFKMRLGYVWDNSLLCSESDRKKYLDTKGNLHTMKEATFLSLSEQGISFNAGLEIPVYGAFIQNETNLESIYYLYGGVSGSHYFNSDATQFLQIANAKDDIRYQNGRDTLNLINEKELSTMILTKYRLEFGVGLNMLFDEVGLGYELTYSFPLTNVMTDQTWRQHVIKLTVSIIINP